MWLKERDLDRDDCGCEHQTDVARVKVDYKCVILVTALGRSAHLRNMTHVLPLIYAVITHVAPKISSAMRKKPTNRIKVAIYIRKCR
jgi:hypothetical protein